MNGTTAEQRIGPGVILKVMAGDKFTARTFAWYLPGTDNSTDLELPGIVANILSQLTPGISKTGKGTIANEITNSLLQPKMEEFLQTQTPVVGNPKAFLNWV